MGPEHHPAFVNNDLSARVFLRPIGSPLTLGMAGLGIASLVQSGFDLHWVAKSQALEVGLILLAVPFFLQLIASILAYLARDGAGGAAIGVLATSWLAMALVHITGGGHRSGALGLMLLASAGMVACSSLVIATSKPLPAAVFFAVATRFALAGIYELGAGSGWRDAAGILGLVVLAGAAYCALAFELEGQRSRPVLPTFRTGRGRAAVLGNAEAAVDDVVHSAGVRQTT
jgi:succinate-acetate transporter protein